jgi:hypothetical protein
MDWLAKAGEQDRGWRALERELVSDIRSILQASNGDNEEDTA